jgi:hypothetical protein
METTVPLPQWEGHVSVHTITPAGQSYLR